MVNPVQFRDSFSVFRAKMAATASVLHRPSLLDPGPSGEFDDVPVLFCQKRQTQTYAQTQPRSQAGSVV